MGIHDMKSIGVLMVLALAAGTCEGRSGVLPRIVAKDGHFIDADGRIVRFWGVNMVSAFPPTNAVEKIASRLRSMSVNLVRPHHLLRPSRDWIWQSPVSGLSLFKEDSRTPDPVAWESFDALNAALGRQGIYLQLSLHNSRMFLPGDVRILPGADGEDWSAAIKELNARPWQKSIDVRKLLPMVDERCELLQREFAKELLLHRNPHTGRSYGEDPQVLTLEIVNESSFAYALVCGNVFPGYFERKIQARWRDFAAAHGVADVPKFREVRKPEHRRLRADFYRSVDEDYAKRMVGFVRSLGCHAAICYSNLWRGEDALEWQSRVGDYVEDHAYVDPLVVRSLGDWLDEKMVRTRVLSRPYVLGEFNISEGGKDIRAQRQVRTMLPIHAAAYGCFQNLDGITWFAYQHGDKDVCAIDWSAKAEGRESSLGSLVKDGQMLDHFALCGFVFRRGLVSPARTFDRLATIVPVRASSYNDLMRPGVALPFDGAASIRGYGKVFHRAGGRDCLSEPMVLRPPSPAGVFVSDTDELVRDTVRQQLLVSAPCVEAFSGKTSQRPCRDFPHLLIKDLDRPVSALEFATVVVVSLDGLPLGKSRRIALSRTGLDGNGGESCGFPVVGLQGMPDGRWSFVVRRPQLAMEAVRGLLETDSIPLDCKGGRLALPCGIWAQATLELEEGR